MRVDAQWRMGGVTKEGLEVKKIYVETLDRDAFSPLHTIALTGT